MPLLGKKERSQTSSPSSAKSEASPEEESVRSQSVGDAAPNNESPAVLRLARSSTSVSSPSPSSDPTATMLAHKKIVAMMEAEGVGGDANNSASSNCPRAPRNRGGTLRQVVSEDGVRWKQALAPDGTPFWWNTETKETQWEPPAAALSHPSVRNDHEARQAALAAAKKSMIIHAPSTHDLDESAVGENEPGPAASGSSVGEVEDGDEPEDASEDGRVAIMEEIWDTEKQFVEDLEVMVNLYLLPLRDSLKNRADIIDPKNIKGLFANVEQLLAVNQEILAQLDIVFDHANRATDGDRRVQRSLADIFAEADVEQVDVTVREVANVFVKLSRDLRCYAPYCNNFDDSMAIYKQVSGNAAYRSYEDLTRKSTGNQRLDSFISKPVQRICKYPLFFRDLQKTSCKLHRLEPPPPEGVAKTGCTTVDLLSEGLAKMEGVAAHINNEKAKKDNLEKLTAIRLSHTNAPLKLKDSEFITPSRTFFLEALLLKSSPKNKLQARMVFLFSDCLMYSAVKSSSGRMYEYKKTVPLHVVVVRRAPSDSKIITKLRSKSGQKTIRKVSQGRNLPAFGNQSTTSPSRSGGSPTFSRTVGPASPMGTLNNAMDADDDNEGPHAFQIRRSDKDTNRVMTFICGSAYQAEVWSAQINEIIDRFSEKQDQSSRLRKQMYQKEWPKDA